MNADILARYVANRLRVVRQVRYSSANENCLDLVLFLNGLPVATAELKTDFTQSIHDVDFAVTDSEMHHDQRPSLLFAALNAASTSSELFLAENVPPKLYGGIERVVAWLVDDSPRSICYRTLFQIAPSGMYEFLIARGGATLGRRWAGWMPRVKTNDPKLAPEPPRRNSDECPCHQCSEESA
jgi:hypothetical protein